MGLTTSLPSNPSPEVRAGRILYGNDLDENQLRTWYQQEEEAFYEGDAGNGDTDKWYDYMRYVNEKIGFEYLARNNAKVDRLLIMGPGSGKEIEEYYSRNPNCELNFLEASKNFQITLREKFPKSKVIQPCIKGKIDLPSLSVDLVTAFSVLHHIPNVEYVMSEAARVTRSGGYFLVREPCSSMGDWGKDRSATPNERGISKSLLISFAINSGFELCESPTAILFEPFNRLIKKTFGKNFIDSRILYPVDLLTSKILTLNDHYWRDTIAKKFGPSSYFYVLRKK